MDRVQEQADAATRAAEARAAIAKKIASLVGKVDGADDAQGRPESRPGVRGARI